jgi:predicted RNA-binding protein with PIN domain
MPYLVDGNNLAHALGLSRDGLADRDACLKTVAAFCRSRGARATVFFDGPAPGGARTSIHLHRVRVVFSEARSADDLILDLLKTSKSPKDFTLVTSDKSLGDRARREGVTIQRCHEFTTRLDKGPVEAGDRSEKPAGRESSEEIEAWLAVFDPRRK